MKNIKSGGVKWLDNGIIKRTFGNKRSNRKSVYLRVLENCCEDCMLCEKDGHDACLDIEPPVNCLGEKKLEDFEDYCLNLYNDILLSKFMENNKLTYDKIGPAGSNPYELPE